MAELKAAKQIIKKLESDVSKMSTLQDRTQRELADLEVKFMELQVESSHRENNLKKREKELLKSIGDLDSRFKTSHRQVLKVAQLETALNDLKLEKKGLNLQIKLLTNENEKLKKQKEKRSVKQETSRIQIKETSVQTEKGLKMRNNITIETQCNIKGLMRNCDDILHLKQAEIDSLHKSLEDKCAEISHLNCILNSGYRNDDALRIEELTALLNNELDKKKSLQKALDATKKPSASSQLKLDDLMIKLNMEKNKTSSLEQDLQILYSSLQGYQDRNRELERQLSHDEGVQSYMAEVAQMITNNDELSEELTTVKTRLADEREMNAQMLDENRKLCAYIKNVHYKIHPDSQLDVLSLSSKVSELESTSDEQYRSTEKMYALINSLRSKIDVLEQKFLQKISLVRDVRKDMENYCNRNMRTGNDNLRVFRKDKIIAEKDFIISEKDKIINGKNKLIAVMMQNRSKEDLLRKHDYVLKNVHRQTELIKSFSNKYRKIIRSNLNNGIYNGSSLSCILARANLLKNGSLKQKCERVNSNPEEVGGSQLSDTRPPENFESDIENIQWRGSSSSHSSSNLVSTGETSVFQPGNKIQQVYSFMAMNSASNVSCTIECPNEINFQTQRGQQEKKLMYPVQDDSMEYETSKRYTSRDHLRSAFQKIGTAIANELGWCSSLHENNGLRNKK